MLPIGAMGGIWHELNADLFFWINEISQNPPYLFFYKARDLCDLKLACIRFITRTRALVSRMHTLSKAKSTKACVWLTVLLILLRSTTVRQCFALHEYKYKYWHCTCWYSPGRWYQDGITSNWVTGWVGRSKGRWAGLRVGGQVLG